MSTAPTGAEPARYDKNLVDYLDNLGIGDYVSVFQRHGVRSLKLLRMLGAPSGAKVKGAIKQDIADGVQGIEGSPLAAEAVDGITPADVQAWIDAHPDKPPSLDDPAVKAKQERVAEAIKQVQDLQRQASVAAKETSQEQQKEVADAIGDLKSRLDREGLGKFPSAAGTAGSLQDMLTDLEKGLGAVNETLLQAIKTSDMSVVELINEHNLLRGHLLDATGFTPASAGAVIAMPRNASDNRSPDQVDDIGFEYRSESAMGTAERLIETGAATIATVNEAGGGAYFGSGIGAMSVAMRYARSTAEDTDTFARTAGTQVTEIKTHYHRSPTRQINFDTRALQASDLVVQDLRAIAAGPGDDTRAMVRRFLSDFGSHVFGRVTLGGWYKHTATARATTLEQESTLTAAVDTALNWAVSASMSYAGLSGSGSASSATTQGIRNARADARQQTCEVKDFTVTVKTSIKGGIEGLPLDYWVASVQYPPQWKVIDREDPYPVWLLIERIGREQLALDRDASKELAGLFEEVWVQDIFVPSLQAVDSRLFRIVRGKQVRTEQALDQTLREVVQQFGGQLTVTTFATPDELVKTDAFGNWPGNVDEKSTMPVRSLRVYWDGDKVVGFRWAPFDGAEHAVSDVGDHQTSAGFEFDRGETLTSCTIYTSDYGGWRGSPWGIELETSRRRRFVTRTGYTAHPIDVAGRCLMGFHGGRHPQPYISSLGLWLSPVVEPWRARRAELPTLMAAGRQVRPAEPPAGRSGFHVVITDGRSPSEPSAILLNSCFALPDVPVWRYGDHIGDLYAEVVKQIRGDLDQPGNLLIVASFGMDLHLPPTREVIALLQTAGAGRPVETWRTRATSPPVSDWGDGTVCNYILAGSFGSNPGQAEERFELGPSATLTTELAPPRGRSLASR
jgi:hypothetical protein